MVEEELSDCFEGKVDPALNTCDKSQSWEWKKTFPRTQERQRLRGSARMKIFAVAMVRNEIDLIDGFLSYHDRLLDGMIIADMQSSDGTTEVIKKHAERDEKFERIVLPYLAKYQSEVLTTLSKMAFNKGADWVFFIDADEFLQVESRQDLEERLDTFGGEVMHLPWINLVPKEFGTFSKFNLKQEYFWSGRLSSYCKIAISRNYAESYPDYVVAAGNHNVSPDLSHPQESLRLGFPMLHLPVRSIERARYKAANAIDLQKRKHNLLRGEGSHHEAVRFALDGQVVTDKLLAGLASDYGNLNPGPIDPKQAGFPTISLPFVVGEEPSEPTKELSSVDLRSADREKEWQQANLPRDARALAQVSSGMIELLPQPIFGDQSTGPSHFERLPEIVDHDRNVDIGFDDVLNALRMGLMVPPVDVFSAWTNLVPSLGMLFSVLKPRRYVELGVHNGMSFYSACEFSNSLGLGTECIAVDSWEGDPHAGFHDQSVFQDFQLILKEKYPSQIFIKSYFDEAGKLFDNGSIDLIHIDGFHSYEAVKHDFETWLDKLSPRGVMIFHDTNVHERDFGVWRFWAEVSKKYPHIELYHGHGLGILYVGDADNPVANFFRLASENRDKLRMVTHFLEFQSDRAASFRKATAKPKGQTKSIPIEVVSLKAFFAARTADLNMALNSKTWKNTRMFRRWSNSLRKRRGKAKKVWPKPSA